MELLDLGIHPISDDKPGGDDARYEPEYDELQAEIDKLASATAGGEVDWKSVVKLAYVILSTKSKDMKVASYLGVALIHLKEVDGLSTGAKILLDLTTNFWDTMYPAKKRMRGRFNAVSWWAEHVEKYLSEYEGPEIAQPVADALSQRLKDLDSALSDASEDAPMLHQIMDYAARLPVKEPEQQAQEAVQQQADAATDAHQAATDAAVEAGAQPPPQPVPQPAAQPAPASPTPSAAPAPVGDIASHEEYRAALKQGLAELSAVADYLLANDPADRVGYRVRRLTAWLPVAALPPNDGGATMIPPPDGADKDSIVHQLESRDFAGALSAAESRVGQFLFWLDLSRLTAEALDGLGGDYRDALLAVEAETGLFVKRLGGIENLTFSDGTPFADAKTKSWLRSLSREESPGLPSSGGSDSAADEAFAKAQALAKNKKIFDAVTVLQNSLKMTSSGRGRYMLRLGMIRLLTDVSQGGLARAHVEEVLEHVKEFRLEEWEPDLALSGYSAAYEALVAEGGEDAEALAKKTLQRIGRINPAAALKINGLS